ncbi:hypothetical protein COJ50_21135 [Bacillus cereus]|uniref:Uncharacterized protein n=1 Tax=Bacillus cereus TaxID=1396 RepID=A0A2B1K436_BACCE|nr:hypothetical protein COJ50_21135 [Bacillus cereus]
MKNLQKKDKIGEYDLILSIREKQVTETILIFMILYFLLIFDIKPIFNIYINIEKFITKLAINDSKSESKLLPKSLHLYILIVWCRIDRKSFPD